MGTQPIVNFPLTAAQTYESVDQDQRGVVKVVAMSNPQGYLVANTDPETADNAGSFVTNPGGISRADVKLLQPQGGAFLLRFQYPQAATGVVGPVVQCFGQSRDGVWEKLYDADGVHEQSLDVSSEDVAYTDKAGNAWYLSDAVEIDTNGCVQVIVAIETVASGTGMTGDQVILRPV